MRKRGFFEAYLDDYKLINIYISEMSYGGISSFFYLQTEDNHEIDLKIISTEIVENNYHYYKCTFDGKIDFGKEYMVISSHGRNIPLIFAQIVKTKQFNAEFFYDKTDLGCQYSKDHCSFKVWAPTAYDVKLEIKFLNNTTTYEMERGDRGVYEIAFDDDMLGATYVYIISVNGKINRSLDPYGKASTPNSKQSVVVDTTCFENDNYPLPMIEAETDSIIYELSIRDMTDTHTFNAITNNRIKGRGFEYLSSLGVTHLQLMPVLDFKSVDEVKPSRNYNWGYDVYQWMSLENSYSSDPKDPAQVMRDFHKFVVEAHRRGLRVNLDVVFNHMFDIEESPMQCTVPYYYFQVNSNDEYSNATMCGNDIDSSMPMCSKMIRDACAYLLDTYNIDGLRFDLMGILDYVTLNNVASYCKSHKPSFLIYGEGWNMPSYLPEPERASIQNNAKMPEVGHFSDAFRNTIKGNLRGNTLECGYTLGNTGYIFTTMNVLTGSVGTLGGNKLFDKITNVVNYVECHDNMTSWDQIELSMEDNYENKIRRHKLLIACVLLAQGIPFIHCGQEFARTKGGINDSYDASDSINRIDYNYRDQHLELIEYTKQLIQIRKEFECFRLWRVEDVYHCIFFENIDMKVLLYKLDYKDEHLCVFINPTKARFTYPVPARYRTYFYNQLLDSEESADELNIEPLSVIILKG